MKGESVFSKPVSVVDPMTEADCRMFLACRTFGRVGMTNGGLPVILPVRYFYVYDAITFRAEEATKLRAAASGDVLAFEVDAYDPDLDEGWSVLVLGRATVLTTEHEFEELPTLDAALTGDACNRYVRLQCELISGRRLGGTS
jgi:nitroimidazol reductase NimA-like FMN-containing flavoprotein (pyridoxamine 5'-phosphate oxidase superfamily)